MKKSVKILLCFLLVILLALTGYALFPKERKYMTEGVMLTEAMGVPVYTELVEEGSVNRPGTTREIRYLVIHETDNYEASATAANHANYLIENADQRVNGWHYTVDDNEIWHSIPDEEVCWHAGDQQTPFGGNMNGVGIELCVNEGSDFEKTKDNAARLVAVLCKEYKLTIDDVKKHEDFSGKICPNKMIEENQWDDFLLLVEKYIKELK